MFERIVLSRYLRLALSKIQPGIQCEMAKCFFLPYFSYLLHSLTEKKHSLSTLKGDFNLTMQVFPHKLMVSTAARVRRAFVFEWLMWLMEDRAQYA